MLDAVSKHCPMGTNIGMKETFNPFKIFRHLIAGVVEIHLWMRKSRTDISIECNQGRCCVELFQKYELRLLQLDFVALSLILQLLLKSLKLFSLLYFLAIQNSFRPNFP